MSFEEFYMKNQKKILIVPILIFILSIIILGSQLATKGYIIDRDVTLKGGISATIHSNQEINLDDLESQLRSEFPNSDFSVRQLSAFGSKENIGIVIEATDLTSKQIREFIENNLETVDISIQEMGSGLGSSFLTETITAILIAFVLIIIVILIAFRKFIPSLAIILSLILDLTATLAIISILGVKISSAGIAAFLMVIGYSIDTDILLTTRLIKRKMGTKYERLKGAFNTGMLMTITTLTALTIGYFVTNSLILKQMFSIILIALVIDIISTWMMNAPILLNHLKKHETQENI